MWQPEDTCISCGSKNVEIGDPEEETSKCLDCGASWGGANYWKTPYHRRDNDAKVDRI